MLSLANHCDLLRHCSTNPINNVRRNFFKKSLEQHITCGICCFEELNPGLISLKLTDMSNSLIMRDFLLY